MRRREFIGLIGAAVAGPLAARAQPSGKPLRVGTVSLTPRTMSSWIAFEKRMAELGYREGETYVFDFVIAPGVDALGKVYQELMKRNPDIIVTGGTEQNLKAALVVSGTTPIVMLAADFDPLEHGYISSLGRPGGTITGIFLQQIELTVKRLQFFKEAFPAMDAATVIYDRVSTEQWRAAERASAQLRIRLIGVDLDVQPYDYERALSRPAEEFRKYLFVPTSPLFFRDRAQIAELASRLRMASIFGFRQWVDAGGLISYGPNNAKLMSRVAEYVDRLARGAKPAELPVEQPTKFELVINLNTAKTLGIDIPSNILARADEVIE